MKKLFIILAMMLFVNMGCITTGSKDKAMIRTVVDVLVLKEEISQEDGDIIVNIMDSYEEESL